MESNNLLMKEEIPANEESTEDEYAFKKAVVEALLFVSAKPLGIAQVCELADIKPKEAEKMLAELVEDYKTRGVNVIISNKEYKMATCSQCSLYVEKFLKVYSKHFLSKAALETLAIVAFKQPVTRAQIEEVRGVNIDKIMNKLLEKKLIKEVGKAPVLGKPALYGTTKEFLHYFHLKDMNELPKFDLEEETEALTEIEHTIEEDIVHHIDEEVLQKNIKENEEEENRE